MQQVTGSGESQGMETRHDSSRFVAKRVRAPGVLVSIRAKERMGRRLFFDGDVDCHGQGLGDKLPFDGDRFGVRRQGQNGGGGFRLRGGIFPGDGVDSRGWGFP